MTLGERVRDHVADRVAEAVGPKLGRAVSVAGFWTLRTTGTQEPFRLSLHEGMNMDTMLAGASVEPHLSDFIDGATERVLRGMGDRTRKFVGMMLAAGLDGDEIVREISDVLAKEVMES